MSFPPYASAAALERLQTAVRWLTLSVVCLALANFFHCGTHVREAQQRRECEPTPSTHANSDVQ